MIDVNHHLEALLLFVILVIENYHYNYNNGYCFMRTKRKLAFDV